MIPHSLFTCSVPAQHLLWPRDFPISSHVCMFRGCAHVPTDGYPGQAPRPGGNPPMGQARHPGFRRSLPRGQPGTLKGKRNPETNETAPIRHWLGRWGQMVWGLSRGCPQGVLTTPGNMSDVVLREKTQIKIRENI